MRAARLILYAIALPPLAMAPFALKEPERPAGIAIAALLALVAVLLLLPTARARFVRWDHRLVRAADTVLWNCLLVLVLAEAALAVAARFSSHPLFAAPNARGRWHVAYVRDQLRAMNGAGAALHPGSFNDTEWRMPKPPGSLRIVALGDSFAYGIVGYERNFLTALEPRLSERFGRPVEVANLGLPWLGPIDYLYLLEQEGLPLQPDAVLICLFAGNDFRGNKDASWLNLQRYRVYESTRRAVLLAAEYRRRSRDQRADGPLSQLTARLPVATPPGTAVTDEPSFSAEAYRDILLSYTKLLRTDPANENRAKTEERIPAVLAVLDRIVALAQPRPVAIAVLPSELQVDPGLQEVLLTELGVAPGSLDVDLPFRVVAEHFAGRGVLVIDLLPPLAAAHRTAPAYHPRDSHWNERGNAAAAAAIADAIGPWLRARG